MKMENNKSPRMDGVVAGDVKIDGDQLLTLLIACSTNTSTRPIHRFNEIINLVQHLYKLFTKIITKWIETKIDFYQPERQTGFRRGYGTNDHLLIIKSVEYNRPKVLRFVEFHQAFFKFSNIVPAWDRSTELLKPLNQVK